MADGRKSQLPEEIAGILENFKQQSSSSRPRIGISNRNFLGYGASTSSDADQSFTKRILFSSGDDTNASFSTPTDVLIRSSTKRKSQYSLDDLGTPSKIPLTPGGKNIIFFFKFECMYIFTLLISGDIDWSPACREQRNKLLETVDQRINDLRSMASKHEQLKKQMMEAVEIEKNLVERQKEKNKDSVSLLRVTKLRAQSLICIMYGVWN